MSTWWASFAFSKHASFRLFLGCIALLNLLACDIRDWVRVPIVDVGTEFLIADATWFEAEQTLFVFYHIEAREGLSVNSVVELTYRTDDESKIYAPLESYPRVHLHLPVSCGERSLCGSYSTHVERMPRDVGIQIRYHRDGSLALEADVAAHVVTAGPAHQSRSAAVYGVFDEVNTHVQWRLRHQFPSIRNEDAQALGLRRDFSVDDVGYGEFAGGRDLFFGNVYGYGALASCPSDFIPHLSDVVSTSERAIFDPVEFPVPSYPFPMLCGVSTVKDALGDFSTTSMAQKNPETRDAFPELRTPVTENLRVSFMLEVCNDPNSAEHRAMQQQRLFLNESDVICIDDWNTQDFPSRLATRFTAEINASRILGQDMVLVIALSRPDNPAIAARVEQALALVVPPENDQATPRLSGAFVYDSIDYSMQNADLRRLVLWCPSGFGGDDLGALDDASTRSCALQATMLLRLTQDITLAQLPILPTEPQFEDFIEDHGVGQTGYITDMSIRAPTRTATSTNLPVGDFGVATFFNEEAIYPAVTDGFSYCAIADTGTVVFHIEGFDDVFPLSVLGEVHAAFPQTRYELGLFWDFPFLMHIDYESVLAAALGLPEEIPFVAAFGLSSPEEQFLGSATWEKEVFEVGPALTQCTRFCDHPTFDNAGVYNVDDLFITYASRCYRPRFPVTSDGGFPIDP
ncbi:MAG: hypothetical protein GY822_11475 [Deltaproteobacteria bacterium]|nr:hypothetical protein [Deltaproteobacteria bacterium]